MSGTPIQLFNNFVESTGPLYITSPDGVINDAQLHKTYSIASIMGGDRGKKKMVDGGSELRFETFFETGGRTRYHQPGATQNWAQPQKLVHGRAPWRYIISDMSWNLQSVVLNMGSSPGFQQYVNEKVHLEQMMWTDVWDFMETNLWAEPVSEEMESLQGGDLGKWYSIPAFINEYTDGLFNKGPSSPGGTAFTTLHGLDPASTVRGQDRFKIQTASYSNEVTDSTEVVSTGTILGAFEKMWKKVHFEKPPTHGSSYSDPAYNNQSIFTSPEGQTAYAMTLRAFQDQFVIEGRQDPAYPDPAFNFIPVKYVNALTTATLYPNHATIASATDSVSEGTAGNGNVGPRYYWVNSNYLYPTFHEEYFFKRGGVREHYNDPDTFVIPVRTWGNIICTSRQRQGLVSPSQDVYSSLYS